MAPELAGVEPAVSQCTRRFPADADPALPLTEQLGGHKSVARKADQKHALAIFAAIEGAQLVARGRGDITAYDQAIEAYRAAGLIP